MDRPVQFDAVTGNDFLAAHFCAGAGSGPSCDTTIGPCTRRIARACTCRTPGLCSAFAVTFESSTDTDWKPMACECYRIVRDAALPLQGDRMS